MRFLNWVELQYETHENALRSGLVLMVKLKNGRGKNQAYAAQQNFIHPHIGQSSISPFHQASLRASNEGGVYGLRVDVWV